MSSVTTTVLESPPPPPIEPFPVPSFKTCHQCGADLSHSHSPVVAEDDAQKRIAELETQVKLLTGKATAAVDKLADYEDEIRQLKSSRSNPATDPIITAHSPPPPPSAPAPAPAAGTRRHHLQSRLSHLLTSNRRAISQPPSSSDLANQTGHTTNNSRDNAELLSLLTREQSLRQAAESRVSETNEELEELSAQLFAEANEMVATERKARAKLEERVAVLERRDKEKRTRLELLESRLGRIERVRELLK